MGRTGAESSWASRDRAAPATQRVTVQLARQQKPHAGHHVPQQRVSSRRGSRQGSRGRLAGGALRRGTLTRSGAGQPARRVRCWARNLLSTGRTKEAGPVWRGARQGWRRPGFFIHGNRTGRSFRLANLWVRVSLRPMVRERALDSALPLRSSLACYSSLSAPTFIRLPRSHSLSQPRPQPVSDCRCHSSDAVARAWLPTIGVAARAVLAIRASLCTPRLASVGTTTTRAPRLSVRLQHNH